MLMAAVKDALEIQRYDINEIFGNDDTNGKKCGRLLTNSGKK
jgi:hypothetical protein